MRISSPSGDFVDLRLDGYQFETSSLPPVDGTDYDANWLFVSGRAQWRGETWSSRDPLLLTWEAHELLDWMRSASPRDPQSIEFLEPNLTFRVEHDSAESPTIVVTLSGEAAPPNLSHEERWSEGLALTFSMSAESLAAAAGDWERELAAYPER